MSSINFLRALSDFRERHISQEVWFGDVLSGMLLYVPFVGKLADSDGVESSWFDPAGGEGD